MTILGDHIRTKKGYAFKSEWYSDCGHPLLKVSDFTDDSVDTSELEYIPEEIANKYLDYEVKRNDVIIQTVGSWPHSPQSVVGKVIRIPSQVSGVLLNQNAVRIIPDNYLDNTFLFYLLRDTKFKSYIISTAQGAASQASITLDSIKRFSFNLPSLPTQLKIAAILSGYDDLIENNLRRIKILGEMAQNLYAEWFVNFHFPGNNKVKTVDSPLGRIPEGWEVTNVRELIDEQNSRNKENKSLPVLSVTHDRSFVASEKYFSKRVYSKSVEKYKVLQKFDFAFNPSRLNIGSIAILDEYNKAIVSPMYVVFRVKPNRITPFFLWQVLNQDEVFIQIQQLCFGTVRQTFKFHDFGLVKFVLPPSDLRSEYEKLIKPVFAAMDCMSLQVSNLRQTRDLLLPKLICGELDVSYLNIKTGDDE